MFPLPNGTALGRLQMVEAFDYYDGPKLFVCENGSGQRYLAIAVDELGDVQTWLCVPISRTREEELRAAHRTMREAILQAEDGFVFVVKGKPGGEVEIAHTSTRKIPSDWLPCEGEYLVAPDTASVDEEDVLGSLAAKERRDVLETHIVYPARSGHEAPARLLGAFLGSLQEMFDAIGQVAADAYRDFGPIQPELRAETQLMAVALPPGSLGVRFLADVRPDLFNHSRVGDVMEKFAQVVSAGANPDELRKVLVPLRARAVSKYFLLLRSLARNYSGLEVYWSSPRKGRGARVALSSTQAREALDVVARVESELAAPLVLTGQLVVGDVKSKRYRFGFFEPVQKKRYRGIVLPEAAADFAHATLNVTYRVTLNVINDVSSTTGNLKHRFQLVSMERVGSAANPSEGNSGTK